MRKALAFAALALCASTAARAMTGAMLENYLVRGNDAQRANAIGYVNGVGDALTQMQMTCFPRGVSVNDSAALVIEALRWRPQDRPLPAQFVVGVALMAAHPCANNPENKPKF